jgi:thioredoxin-like negative regulator of GroEL
MIRRRVGRIGADRFDLIDCVQDAADVRPADDAEQDFAAGPDEGQGRIELARAG